MSGSGVLRMGHAPHAVRTNDYIVNLPGGGARNAVDYSSGEDDARVADVLRDSRS